MPSRKAKLDRQRIRRYEFPTRLGSPRMRTWLNCPDVFGPSRWAQIYTPSLRALLQDAPSDGRLQGTESRLTSQLCKSVRINLSRSKIDKKDSGPGDASSSAPLLPKFRIKDDGLQFLGNNLGECLRSGPDSPVCLTRSHGSDTWMMMMDSVCLASPLENDPIRTSSTVEAKCLAPNGRANTN
ncbi:hypothetical protein Landi51_01538 [Colletotrichum acutatum]